MHTIIGILEHKIMPPNEQYTNSSESNLRKLKFKINVLFGIIIIA